MDNNDIMHGKKYPVWELMLGVILIVVILVIVLCVVAADNTDRKIEKQLTLASRYMTELDYEEAIVIYQAVLEIDPKNHEAYAGLFEAYMAMGDIESAEEIVSKVEKLMSDTDDANYEALYDRLLKMLTNEGIISEINLQEETIVCDDYGNGNGDELDIRFNDCVVDGIYHYGYEQVELSVHEEEFINQLIELAKAKDAEGLYNRCLGANDIVLSIINKGSENYLDMCHIAFFNYKVYIRYINESMLLAIIPLDDGEGYYFAAPTIPLEDGRICYDYAVSDCISGMFEGEFELVTYSSDIYDGTTMGRTFGRTVNGLRDGEVYAQVVHQYANGDSDEWSAVYDYDKGKPIVHAIEDCGDYLVIYNGNWLDNNGERITDNPYSNISGLEYYPWVSDIYVSNEAWIEHLYVDITGDFITSVSYWESEQEYGTEREGRICYYW